MQSMDEKKIPLFHKIFYYYLLVKFRLRVTYELYFNMQTNIYNCIQHGANTLKKKKKMEEIDLFYTIHIFLAKTHAAVSTIEI